MAGGGPAGEVRLGHLAEGPHPLRARARPIQQVCVCVLASVYKRVDKHIFSRLRAGDRMQAWVIQVAHTYCGNTDKKNVKNTRIYVYSQEWLSGRRRGGDSRLQGGQGELWNGNLHNLVHVCSSSRHAHVSVLVCVCVCRGKRTSRRRSGGSTARTALSASRSVISPSSERVRKREREREREREPIHVRRDLPSKHREQWRTMGGTEGERREWGSVWEWWGNEQGL